MEAQSYQPLTPAEIKETARAYYRERAGKTRAPEAPTYALVGGQPGAGKSFAGQMVRDELASVGGYIHVDADRMRERIDTKGTKPSSQETQADAGRLVGELRSYAIADRRNVIEEGTFRDNLAALAFVQARKDDGYRVELVAVATPAAESTLGIYQRHEQQHLSGSHNPRFVPQDYHDKAMQGFERSVALVAPLVDRSRVITRDGAVLYDSASRDNKHPSAVAALRAGQQLTPERLTPVQNGWEIVRELAQARGADHAYMAAVYDNIRTTHRLGVALAQAGEPVKAPTPAEALRGTHGLAHPSKTGTAELDAALKLAGEKGLLAKKFGQAVQAGESPKAPTPVEALRGTHGLSHPSKEPSAEAQARAVLQLVRERGIVPVPTTTPPKDRDRDR